MKIQPTNFNNQNYNRQISHKATFPVVHCVAEVNGQFAPIGEKEVVKEFQARLIGYLKSNLKKIYTDIQKEVTKKNKPNITAEEKKEIERKIKSLYEILDVPAQKLRYSLAKVDPDYRLNPTARSFYNDVYGSAETAYVVTGDGVNAFEKEYCHEYGKQRSLKIKRIKSGATKEEAETPEYKRALNKYLYGGFDYVNYYPRRIKNNGKTLKLYTKFVIEKDAEGKFLGYRFAGADFYPER